MQSLSLRKMIPLLRSLLRGLLQTRENLELIAAPQQDVVVAVVKKERKKGPVGKQQKERSDKGKERTKINKLQVAKGVRRVKVNTKWHVLGPEVSDIVFEY